MAVLAITLATTEGTPPVTHIEDTQRVQTSRGDKLGSELVVGDAIRQIAGLGPYIEISAIVEAS